MRDSESLESENAELRCRLADAETALRALARGEIDAVADEAGGTTLLRAAQQQLRESQSLLRSIFDSSLDALVLADDQGRYVDVNPSACELFRLPREKLLGRSLAEFAAPDYDATRAYQEFKEHGRMRGLFPLRRVDGTRGMLEYSAVANVAPGLHLSALRDVSERVAAEQAVRESRRQLEEAQAIAHVGSWVSGLGPDDTIHWTAECCRIFGVPVGTTLTVADLFARVHPADREALARANADAIERGTPVDIEHRVLRPDGRPCWVHVQGSIERPAADEPGRMVGTVQDITERHGAVDALNESARMLRAVFDNTSDALIVFDERGVYRDVNPATCELFGRPREELLGRVGADFYVDCEVEAARKRLHADGHAAGELTLRRPGGDLRFVEFYAKTNIIPGLHLAIFRDVTARREADERRAHLAAIVESSDEAIIGTDADGIITSWNRSAERLFQWSAAEIVGRPLMTLVPPERAGEVESRMKRLQRGEVVRHPDALHMRKDGSVVPTAITASPIFDGQGRVVGSARIVRDLTETRKAADRLRQAEEQLRQAQKMEAVGVLAGGVAHDFNNALSVILSFTSLILGDLKAADPMRADVEEIGRAAERATDLTRQLLAFSRKQMLAPQVLELGRTVLEMERMLQRLLGEAIELTLLAPAPHGRVLADSGQVEQIVMNLAVNARDAMPDGGKLTIEVADVDLDEEYTRDHAGMAPGPYVMLAVTDSGTGIDEATRQRIFEPFFTTKGVGRGTGLGLSTVFGIVQQSQGHIWVYSELGVGTTFKIYLPRVARPVSATEAPPAAPQTLRGTETVLVVEDEVQVRLATCTILRRHGYHVLDAQNGGEALLICEQFDGAIHLLVTDVVMPRMSGRQVAERLALTRPGMKVLYVSGYTEGAIVHHGVLDPGIQFLQKPIQPNVLLRKIREVLDG